MKRSTFILTGLCAISLQAQDAGETVTAQAARGFGADGGAAGGLGLFNSNWGSNDNKLSVFQGQYSDAMKGVFSAEENLILQAAAPDTNPNVGITIYWVAGVAGGGDCFRWPFEHADSEATGEAKWLEQIPFLGYAGKAMKSMRPNNPSVRRVIWLWGGFAANLAPGDNGINPSAYGLYPVSMEFVLAHELGHALGDLVHTLEKYGVRPFGNTGYSDYSDNLRRLMTGIPGPRRSTEPKQLNITERNLIANFDEYVK